MAFIMGFLSYLFAGGVDVLTSLTVTEAQYNNNQVELTLSDGRKVGKTENRFTCICRLLSCIMLPRSCSVFEHECIFVKNP